MVSTITPTKLKFQPLHDYVLILADPRARSVGGIELPEGTEIDPPTGVVIAIGPEVREKDGCEQVVEVGDRVYLMAQAYAPPIPLRLGGKEYTLVHAGQLIGRAV